MKAKGAEKERKWFALLILAIIALFLLYAAVPLLGGIFGAAIFYVLFKPMYFRLLKRTNNMTASALIVVLVSIVFIIIPLFYLVYVAFQETGCLIADLPEIEAKIAPLVSGLGLTSDDIVAFLEEHADSVAGIVESITIATFDMIVNVSLNLVVLYLIFYFALTQNEGVLKGVRAILPFSRKNSERLMKEFSHVIRTTVLGNGAASIVLGVLLAIGLMVLGFENFFFWALVGSIMAFIPIIGIQLIWIPIGAYCLIMGDYAGGIGIIVWGAFLSYIMDGLVRQHVQRKIGEIHPLLSLIGLIIGITYFGIMGIIVGPLILAVFVMLARMFKEEYVPGWG